MVTWYWSADNLIWQVSIDHNMMSYTKKYKVNQGGMSLSTYYLEDGRHLVRLHRRCRCHRYAYAPTSNTASHDTHNHGFLYGLCLAAFRAARAPLIFDFIHSLHVYLVLMAALARLYIA